MVHELETVNDEAIPEDLQGLKVGDEVFCLMFGHGVVEEVELKKNYPIGCIFDGVQEYFMSNGFWLKNRGVRRTLYRANSGVIEIDTAKVEVFEKGQKVWASDNNTDWKPRYYSHFKNGWYYCFANGGTEWSSSGLVTGWNRVSSTDPNAEAAQ